MLIISKIFFTLKGAIMRVGVLASVLLNRKRKENGDTVMAEKGREEPKGGSERTRKKVIRKGESRLESKVTSKEGRQSKKSQLSSKDGERKRTRVQGRKTNKTSSKSKSMGSK
jgi:hypothetical protein